MRLYTGFFGNRKLAADATVRPISIAASCPRWFKGPSYRALAPEWSWMGSEDYLALYTGRLAGLDLAAVVADLHRLAGGRNPVACCWCSPRHFCHRRVFAQFLEEKLGLVVAEYGFARADTPDFNDLPDRE
jgi:hypothetical protein